MTDSPPVNAIRETRALVGEPPRSLPASEAAYAHIAPPSWMRGIEDDLERNYLNVDRLLEHGTIVWGVTVQVNGLMFSRWRRIDCPGTVIYGLDTEWSDELTPLFEIAAALGRLKSAPGATEDELRYGDMLADEHERAIGWPVPTTCTDGRAVISTGVVFHRKHLPRRRVTCGFYPLLVDPVTKASMILPSRYWAPWIVEQW